jgi:predicted phage-related endonuclease
MNIINTPQGSQDWLQIRKLHRTASEAPAAFGVSKFTSRTELLKQKHSGITEEVGGAKQALFDRGHEAEAAARPFANRIVDDDLYPVTGTLTIGGVDLLASLDGVTMDESIIWEHKLYSEKLAADVRAGTLAPHYTIQLDQQLLVSGANKCLFMTSDGTEENMAWCWYESSQAKFDALVAGWQQFNIDLAAYTPTEVVQAAVAAPVMALPAVSVQVNGQLAVISNLDVFEVAVRAYINNLPTKPATDQEFADADAGCKAMSRAEDALSQVKTQTLGQVASVDYVVRTADMLADLCRTTRLALEKLVKARKEAIRTEIVEAARATFREHCTALDARLGRPYMPAVASNFAEVIKGKKTVESLQNAVDTEMARAKVEANAVADKIQANLATLEQQGDDYKHLFADTAQIVLKAPDDLTALVKSRISDFKASEEKRLEAEREKIRAEEVAKIEKAAADAALVEAARLSETEEAAAVMTEAAASVIAGVAPIAAVSVSFQKTPLTVVAKSEPVYTEATTRDKLNMLLGQMAEADLVRTLHFVQQRFFSVEAA